MEPQEIPSLPRLKTARQHAVIPTCLVLGVVTGFTQVHGAVILSVDSIEGVISAWDSESFDSFTTFASGLPTPIGVGVDSAGFIYVTTYDTTGSILKYNAAGAVVDSITGLSFRPYAITQGPDGFLYTADATGQRIVRINTSLDSGTLSTWTTMVGQPTALQFDSSGNLFVTTAANGDDIQKFSPTGTLLQVLADDGILGGFPSGIALDSDGDIYVGRSFTGADVAQFNTSGTLIDATFASVPAPYGLFADNTYLFVGSTNGTIYRFSLADGSLTGTLTPGSFAAQMTFAPAGVPEPPVTPFVGITGVLSAVAYRRFRHRRTAAS